MPDNVLLVKLTVLFVNVVVLDPVMAEVLVKSALAKVRPPCVEPSCILIVFTSVSTEISPAAPVKATPLSPS